MAAARWVLGLGLAVGCSDDGSTDDGGDTGAPTGGPGGADDRCPATDPGEKVVDDASNDLYDFIVSEDRIVLGAGELLRATALDGSGAVDLANIGVSALGQAVADDRFVYFADMGLLVPRSLSRVPIGGGRAEVLVPPGGVLPGYLDTLAIRDGRLWWSGDDGRDAVIRHTDLEGGDPVTVLTTPGATGLTTTPFAFDGDRLWLSAPFEGAYGFPLQHAARMSVTDTDVVSTDLAPIAETTFCPGEDSVTAAGGRMICADMVRTYALDEASATWVAIYENPEADGFPLDGIHNVVAEGPDIYVSDNRGPGLGRVVRIDADAEDTAHAEAIACGIGDVQWVRVNADWVFWWDVGDGIYRAPRR